METPALEHLMGAYLHQDFDQFGTIDENVDLFVLETPELAPLLPKDVEKVIALGLQEVDLETLLDELGCQVVPPGNLTYREWLTQIADRVRTATT